MLLHPAGGGQAIVDRHRKRKLGREAIVDRDHGAARLHGQIATQHIMGVEVADHPAAAMKIDQHRQRAGRCRQGAIQAQRNRAVRAVSAQFANRVDLACLGLGEKAPLAVLRAGGDRVLGMDGRHIAAGDQIEQGFCLRVEHEGLRVCEESCGIRRPA